MRTGRFASTLVVPLLMERPVHSRKKLRAPSDENKVKINEKGGLMITTLREVV